MDRSIPGFAVHHQLPELPQTHVCQVSDAIQPSHPLSSPSPPAFNLPQHQGLFQSVTSLHQVAKVLELQPSNEFSGLISFRIDWFDLLAVQGKVFLVVVVFLTSLATLHFWLIFIFWINLLLVVMTANHSDWRCKRSSPNDASPATWRYLTYSFQRFTSLLLHGLTRLALKETSSLHSKETTAH